MRLKFQEVDCLLSKKVSFQKPTVRYVSMIKNVYISLHINFSTPTLSLVQKKQRFITTSQFKHKFVNDLPYNEHKICTTV